MNTEKLYEFLVLAQTLNFSKAAARLFITQSILSRHIQEIENELGAKLFQRSPHSVSLTEAGSLLLRDAKHITEKSDAALSRLRKEGLQAVGSLRIACSEIALCGPFLDFIKKFTAKYSEILLDINVICESTKTVPLSQFDISFFSFELPSVPEGIQVSHIFNVAPFLTVPSSHKFAGKQSIGLNELSGEQLLVPFADELFGTHARHRQLAEKYTAGKVHVTKVPSTETALLYVELKAGVAIIPKHLIRSDYSGTRLVSISTPNCDFSIYQYLREGNNTARLFVDELQNSLPVS